MKQIQGDVIKSVRTVSNYEQSLSKLGDWAKYHNHGDLRTMTPQTATAYLDERSEYVSQSTLDMDRQAIQAMMVHVTHELSPNNTLPRIISELELSQSSRAYTSDQIHLISNSQSDRHSLSTEIAHSAGLRAHELITIQPIQDAPPDKRPALESKFDGRDGERYTVTGKGGLTREIVIPNTLVQRLEEQKFNIPQKITDRGIHYKQYYDIGAGQRWSNSFSAASNRALGWSNGGHGLRHSYAQERMGELTNNMQRSKALETVSQEMGHFRPEITEVYLR